MENRGACILTSDAGQVLRDRIAASKPGSVTILTDDNTYQHCYPLLKEGLSEHRCITVPAGEENKTINGAVEIWSRLTELQIDRRGLLIVLGGGVLGDMGGFCAATYKRGIGFILVPTTLLAQVDASVGGKLGIDFQHLKNHIGLFEQPLATVIDTRFLGTLPKDELRSGFAEVIKHCFLSDPHMWSRVCSRSLERQDWNELVAHSVAFKERIVASDPKESGIRKVLNFGHTIGHAIESRSLMGERLLHGEAIAIGMICESHLALRKGLLEDEALQGLTRYILNVFGHREIGHDDESLMRLMRQDKKTTSGRILLALADGKGGHHFDVPVTETEISEALGHYRSLDQI